MEIFQTAKKIMYKYTSTESIGSYHCSLVSGLPELALNNIDLFFTLSLQNSFALYHRDKSCMFQFAVIFIQTPLGIVSLMDGIIGFVKMSSHFVGYPCNHFTSASDKHTAVFLVFLFQVLFG